MMTLRLQLREILHIISFNLGSTVYIVRLMSFHIRVLSDPIAGQKSACG